MSGTLTGELALISLATDRCLRVNKSKGSVTADSPGPQLDCQDGVPLTREETK
jgi:hypothetical protein